MKTYILVDFENTPIRNTTFLGSPDAHLLIFIGKSQSKLSSELVVAVQELGARARYVRMAGSGKNALDFHVACYLGSLSATEPDAEFIIVSKDTGFDPLVEHLKGKGVSLRRVSDAESLRSAERQPTVGESRIERVERFLKANVKNRPARLKTLLGSIQEWIGKEERLSEEELNGIVASLQTRGVLQVNAAKVVYKN